MKQISPSGLKLIKSWEQCVLKPYKDSGGYWTCCWGHLMQPWEKTPGFQNRKYSQEEADHILYVDTQRYVHTTNSQFSSIIDKMSQNAFDSLVDFAYNNGSFAKAATLVNMVNHGITDKETVIDTFLMYDRTANREDKGLKNRRAQEAALYLQPDPLDYSCIDLDRLMATVYSTSVELYNEWHDTNLRG